MPEFLALNPNAQVPVIIDDGFVLWESQRVMRYLAGKHGSGLWPADLRERARGRPMDELAVDRAQSGLGLSRCRRCCGSNPAYDDQAKIAQGDRRSGRQRCGWSRRRLARRTAFVANGRFSLADIVIALSTHRWMMTPFDKPELPAVEAHYAANAIAPGRRWHGRWRETPDPTP